MSENKYNKDYDDNKIPDTIYVSKRTKWNGRYVSQIIEEEQQCFAVSEKENTTLYITSGGKQKIQATLLETGKEKQVPVLYVSRINVKTGKIASSGEQQMCLYPEVLEKLYNFIGKIKSVDYSNSNSFKITEKDFKNLDNNPVVNSDSYFKDFIRESPKASEILENLIDEGLITSKDIVNTSFRKKGLQIFKKLIDNTNYWETYADENKISKSKEEKVWQYFFEKNEWIFGYGLDYRFKTILQHEAHVSDIELDGSNTVIADYLLGDKRFTTFIEMKKPSTELFGKTKNRSNSWKLSNDVIESVSQILEQKASGLIKLDKQQFNSDGDIITQKAYDSKVILLIGHWKQLEESKNDLEREIKKKTFELFRTDSRNIEILTYDELFERAKFIVEGIKEEYKIDKYMEDIDDLPF